MTLYVEADGLTAAEKLVQSAADDVIAARNHLEENGKIIWILDGIINIVQDEVWTSPTSASLEVTIPGKPGEMKGSIAIACRLPLDAS